MIDFVRDVCTPAKVYFLIMTFLFAFSLVTGRMMNMVKKIAKKDKGIKKKFFPFITLITIIALVLIVFFTLIFNYFCSLGYVNVVGVVVFCLVLRRFYTMYEKGA
jgi:Flp pilus assembly protein TadB